VNTELLAVELEPSIFDGVKAPSICHGGETVNAKSKQIGDTQHIHNLLTG
jgi:hypothetical protein